MGLTVKNNTAYAVTIESTEGTYQAPASATDFVQTLSDGAELTSSKEVLERNVFTGSIGKVTPRTGQFQSAGTIPVEARAHSVAGQAPEYDALMRSALGSRRQRTTATTTKSSGNTGSQLQIADADIGAFNVGDIVMIKEAGAYHVSPVTAVDSTSSAAHITLLVPRASGSFPASVVIEKSTTYTVANAGHPSLSVSKYIEGTILEKGVGMRVNKLDLSGFTTGKLPSFKFGMSGLNFDRSVTTIPYSPAYDSALPPIVLEALVYQDGVSIEINELAFSLENTLGFKSATSAANGKISGRATERKISGTMNPYKANDNIDNFLKYKNNQSFSLFAYAKVPTGVAGEFGQVVAFYMPNCVMTDLGEADADGLLQDTISFSSDRGTSGTVNEIYIVTI